MKKQLACLLALTLSAAVPAFAAPISQDDQTAMTKSVDQMSRALENHDAASLVDQSFDYVVNEAGGRDAYLKTVQSSFQTLESKHYHLISFVPQIPHDSVDAGPYEVCTIKESTTFEYDGHTIRAEGYLLGIRKKDEKDWKFLDGAGISKNPETLKKALPSLPASFKAPEISFKVDNGPVTTK